MEPENEPLEEEIFRFHTLVFGGVFILFIQVVTWGPMVAPDENLQVCDTNDGQNPAPLKIHERSSAAKMLSIMCCAQCLQKGTWFSWVLPKQTFCGGSYLPTQNVRNHLRHRER